MSWDAASFVRKIEIFYRENLNVIGSIPNLQRCIDGDRSQTRLDCRAVNMRDIIFAQFADIPPEDLNEQQQKLYKLAVIEFATGLSDLEINVEGAWEEMLRYIAIADGDTNAVVARLRSLPANRANQALEMIFHNWKDGISFLRAMGVEETDLNIRLKTALFGSADKLRCARAFVMANAAHQAGIVDKSIGRNRDFLRFFHKSDLSAFRRLGINHLDLGHPARIIAFSTMLQKYEIGFYYYDIKATLDALQKLARQGRLSSFIKEIDRLEPQIVDVGLEYMTQRFKEHRLDHEYVQSPALIDAVVQHIDDTVEDDLRCLQRQDLECRYFSLIDCEARTNSMIDDCLASYQYNQAVEDILLQARNLIGSDEIDRLERAIVQMPSANKSLRKVHAKVERFLLEYCIESAVEVSNLQLIKKDRKQLQNYINQELKLQRFDSILDNFDDVQEIIFECVSNFVPQKQRKAIIKETLESILSDTEGLKLDRKEMIPLRRKIAKQLESCILREALEEQVFELANRLINEKIRSIPLPMYQCDDRPPEYGDEIDYLPPQLSSDQVKNRHSLSSLSTSDIDSGSSNEDSSPGSQWITFVDGDKGVLQRRKVVYPSAPLEEDEGVVFKNREQKHHSPVEGAEPFCTIL